MKIKTYYEIVKMALVMKMIIEKKYLNARPYFNFDSKIHIFHLILLVTISRNV